MSIPSLISADTAMSCGFSGSLCNYEEEKFYKYGGFDYEGPNPDPSKYFSTITSQGTDTCGGAWTDTTVYSIEGNGLGIPFKVTQEDSHEGQGGDPPIIGQYHGEDVYGQCDYTINTTYSNPVDGIYLPTDCTCDPQKCSSPNINPQSRPVSRIAYVSSFVKDAIAFNLNSYGASAVKSMNLQIVHEPSPTCYFKAWVGLETYPVLAANGGTFFEWTTGANPNFSKLGTYVWDKRGGDCPSPSSLYLRPTPDIIIDSTIYSPSAEENTAVYLVVYKTSLFPDYEPADPAGW